LVILLAGCTIGTPPPTQTIPATSAPSATVIPPAQTPLPSPTLIPPTNTPPPSATAVPSTQTPLPSATLIPPTETPPPTLTVIPATPAAPAARIQVPGFDHIVVILFENHGYNEVIGKSQLTNFNRLARENVLLTQYYAVAHPSLPNYLALIGGSTFGITSDCGDCFINHLSLPDLIEASGRSWKTYQEGMPSPCYVDFTSHYDLNHDPFLYFDLVRQDKTRCEQSVVPLTQLDPDLKAGQLPNFSFIMPDLCHSGHNCDLSSSDKWIGAMVDKLQASPALGQNSLIVVVFDEAGEDNSSCCGLPDQAGGRVAAIVISPLAKHGIQDDTPLSHYSLLKTILLSWNLPALGFDKNMATQAITGIWK
jgi:phosphatidylinositol-3-phosphatase